MPESRAQHSETYLSHLYPTFPMTSQSTPATEGSAASASTQVHIDDAELEKLLNREASAFQRELEVERILKAFKLKYVSLYCNQVIHLSAMFSSPYDVLDIDDTATPEAIKKRYRQLSLCGCLNIDLPLVH